MAPPERPTPRVLTRDLPLVADPVHREPSLPRAALPPSYNRARHNPTPEWESRAVIEARLVDFYAMI